MRHPLAATLLVAMAGTTLAQPRRLAVSRPEARTDRMPRVWINDNRRSAGVLRGNVLVLHLVAKVGMWYPDGDSAAGAPVQAFAEEGHAPRIPGPMIRVRAGAEATVTLRNTIPNTTLVVHGLTSRTHTGPAVDDSVRLATGETRTLHLRLDAPGTYFYWGTTTGRTIGERTREDAQLTGAIVVDEADAPPPVDRVMVMGIWSDTAGHVLVVRKRILSVINGRSWPHTERLDYTMGDTVRWRIINASADMHPMHLHGFYFRVDSHGNWLNDTTYTGETRRRVVTDLVKPGMTMRMTWSPDRPGNWLFHCHLPDHFMRRGPLGTLPIAAPAGTHGAFNHALDGMGGLVMGVVVKPKRGYVPPVYAAESQRRQLRLVVRASAQGVERADAPSFDYVLDDGTMPEPSARHDHVAPPIVLTRGEPVTITVVNALDEPTSVHWHGIELESYYDGVAGFSGTARRLSPVIAPKDSFVARFTPPRHGTFIYHTHIDEGRQQPAGLAGPIIVLEPGERFDPRTDLTVVASSIKPSSDTCGAIPLTILLNGSQTPTPLALRVGVRSRVRLINMTTNDPGLRFDLIREGTLQHWRPLAKDGADLPEAQRTVGAARQSVSIGETADVEITPEREGVQTLEAHLSTGTLIGTLSVLVAP